MRHHGRVVFEPNVENQAIAIYAQVKRVRPVVVPDRCKRVLLEKIVDRDLTLVLDIRIGSTDRFFVQDHSDQTSLCTSGRWLRGAHF